MGGGGGSKDRKKNFSKINKLSFRKCSKPILKSNSTGARKR